MASGAVVGLVFLVLWFIWILATWRYRLTDQWWRRMGIGPNRWIYASQALGALLMVVLLLLSQL